MLFVVAWAMAEGPNALATAPPAAPVVVENDPRNPTVGNMGARFTIAEWSDFQCPHCAGAWRDVENFIGSNADVRLVFMSYPISNACNPAIEGIRHENACYAARAAICASDQGKFAALADQMFGNQDYLDPEQIGFMAQKVGVNAKKFASCLTAKSTAALVSRDIEAAIAAGLQGTPTFFLRDGVGPWRPQDEGLAAMFAEIVHLRGALQP